MRPLLPAPASSAAGSAIVGDVTGMPAAAALRSLMDLGLLPRMSGTGRVIRQDPAPGSSVPAGSVVHLILEPSS